MTTRASTPRANELKPVAWAAVEAPFRAGIRSLKSIGLQFGVVPSATLKHFNKLGIKRDLRARVIAKAQELVNEQAVNAAVNAAGAAVHERDIIGANPIASASVQIAHRTDIARARKLVSGLMAELEDTVERPELFGMIHMVLSNPDEPAIESLRSMARLAESLPMRARAMKDLADTLRILIGLEREAFALDTASGSDGKYLVIIKDYTGKGDPDAPVRSEPYH
jgi:hypothetical protein